MAQDHDVYRRVGRGGAGNFHPAKRADQDPKDKVRGPISPCRLWQLQSFPA